MAAVVQDITAEQGAALSVTFTGAGASLNGRTLRMHVRSKVGVTTTKLVASTTDGRLAVGANPYTTATLAIDADIMAAVSITLPTEYWVYDVESYTTAADVRREWSGRFTITRDVTRDTEATTETALSGAVLYSGPQSLTTAQKLQARDNIGAGTGSGGGSIDDGDKGDITVSGTGTVWTVDNNAITFAKMQAVSADVLLGNDATGTAVQEIACTAAGRALLDDATAADQRTTLGLGTAATTAATAYEASGAVSTHNAVTTAHGISVYGATLVDDADAATARTTLGLGTAATSATGDFAAASHAHAASAITSGTLGHERGGLEADVSAYSGLVKITAGATSAVTVTAAGEALLDDADASAQRSTLGLGGAAVLSVGTTAGTVAAGDHTHTQFTAQSQATWEAGAGTTESVVSPAKIAAAIAALGGGGAGTATFLVRSPLQNEPPASAFATLDTRNSIPCLDFDAAADESAIFSGFAPEAIVLTSGIIARIVWAATSATSGNVRWRVKFERRTTDQDSDSWDTATEATAATNGTSGICTITEITCTTIDSIVAGDSFRVCVTRVGTDGTNDTMTGDAELFGLELRAA